MPEPIPFRRRYEPEQQPARPRVALSEFYPARIIEAPKPPLWLWDGLIMAGVPLLLSGAKAVGKSLLIQQLFTAVSLGLPCLGRATEKAKCFALFCEDIQDRLVGRQLDICAHYGVETVETGVDFAWSALPDRDATLVEYGRGNRPIFTPLWDALWTHVLEEGVRLVAIDTVGACYGGMDVRNQVTPFVRECARMALKIGGAVILSIHPARNNPNTFGGSGAWFTSCRMGMSMQRPADWDEERDGFEASERLLRGLGSNYGGSSGRDLVRWDQGVFVSDQPDPPARPMDAVSRMDLDLRILAGVTRSLSKGIKMPANEHAKYSLPWCARHSVDKEIARTSLNVLAEVQARLEQSGRLIRVSVSGRCLLRPADGRPYDGETPWVW